MLIYEKIKTLSVDDMAEFLTEESFGCVNCSEDKRLSDNPLFKQESCDKQCKLHCIEWLNKSCVL